MARGQTREVSRRKNVAQGESVALGIPRANPASPGKRATERTSDPTSHTGRGASPFINSPLSPAAPAHNIRVLFPELARYTLSPYTIDETD